MKTKFEQLFDNADQMAPDINAVYEAGMELVNKCKWISVKDKLPGKGVGVLIGWFYADNIPLDIIYSNIDCSYQIGYLEDYVDKVQAKIIAGGVDNNYVSLFPEQEPTHWMPLPEPPEESE